MFKNAKLQISWTIFTIQKASQTQILPPFNEIQVPEIAAHIKENRFCHFKRKPELQTK
jgi:hypothetical protein